MLVPWVNYEDISCKDCPFYTGVRCCGHGDYYGSCSLSEKIMKTLENVFDCELAGDKLPEYRYDDSICPFVKKWKGCK